MSNEWHVFVGFPGCLPDYAPDFATEDDAREYAEDYLMILAASYEEGDEDGDRLRDDAADIKSGAIDAVEFGYGARLTIEWIPAERRATR